MDEHVAHQEWFHTTHWSVVLNARSEDSDQAAEALDQLCRIYWSPTRDYLRGRGYSAADAEDLTQQFLAQFLDKKGYQRADRDRGLFRYFLLASLKHFIIGASRRRSEAGRWPRSYGN